MSQALPIFNKDPKEEYEQRKRQDAEKEERLRRLKKEESERIRSAYENWDANFVASPLKDKEMIKNLPPSEKVQVLKAGIEAMKQNGGFDYDKGRSYHHHLTVTRKSLNTALEFFALNPTVSVFRVLWALGDCCVVNHDCEEPEPGEYCKHFYAWKAGASLDFFWNNLANVTTYCSGGLDGPVIYPEVKRKKEQEAESTQRVPMATEIVAAQT